ncbi:15827_t:CDS:2, partial [Funneliformis geosporum]
SPIFLIDTSSLNVEIPDNHLNLKDYVDPLFWYSDRLYDYIPLVKENVELDHDMVVIESDSEITVRKSKGKPSKSLLRKPNPDSSQLNPILKRLKSSELSLPNVYCIEFESEGEGF